MQEKAYEKKGGFPPIKTGFFLLTGIILIRIFTLSN